MEYSQELDKIRTEVENSGKKLEDLSSSIQSLAGLTKLQESLGSFHEDNLFNRIETKIDILAQTDYSELFNFSIDNLKNELSKIDNTLLEKLSSLEQSLKQELNGKLTDSINSLKENILTALSCLNPELTSLNENSYSNTESVSDNANIELIKSKINHISTKLNDYSQFNESAKTDLSTLKENFYHINDKLSETIHLIQTNTGENEELNNRFESNLVHFNSCFQKIYEQFNTLDNTFKNNFIEFKACIQDVYDQYSSIDHRDDLDQIKLYVQSFSNKILSIAEILETLKENGFSLDINKIDTLEKKLDLLAEVDPCELINIFMEESKNSINEIKSLKATFEQNFLNKDKDTTKEDLHEIQSKIDFLNRNTCALLDKFDNDTFEIRLINNKIFEEAQFIKNDLILHKKELDQIKLAVENNFEVNEKLDFILNETQSLSSKMADEFSSLVNPLSSAIELTSGLKDSLEELLSQDDAQIKKETGELLNKFDGLYKDTESNFECLFNASKQFYEKLEEVKKEFSNLSFDTNSKINDFLARTDMVELKIQNSLSNSDNTLNTIKNISRFAENQINLTSENLNILKTGVSELSENFELLKNDITEVSSKLNKIILNEKENSVSLNNSFKDLKEEINKNFEQNIENIDQTNEKIVKKLSDELKTLGKKIDKTEEISSNTLETSEDIKSAIAYTAEWFDTAGKLIEENNRNLKKNSTEKAEFLIKRTEETLSEQIKRISDKLNRFEIRMESIEGKIEKLHDQQNNREVLNVLSDILEKVELSEERSKLNELILNRLEVLESKIEKIEDKKTDKRKKSILEDKNPDLID